MAVVIAYDMYLECATGNVHPSWRVEKPVDFFRFRERLAIQMLQYSPANFAYPGDAKFRAATQVPKKKRPENPSVSSQAAKRRKQDDDASAASLITTQDLHKASKRLCGILDPLVEHVESVGRLPGHNSRVCSVCGHPTYEQCGVCQKALHYHKKRDGMSVPCFIQYHNTSFFGLAKDDAYMIGNLKGKYCLPTDESRKQHAAIMRELHQKALATQHTRRNNSTPRLADNVDSNTSTNQQQQEIDDDGIPQPGNAFL